MSFSPDLAETMREIWATKDEHEREEEEAERLVRPQPKLKPPRRDRRRERIETERDPDTAGDPDLKGDPDRSMNYKSIGGSANYRHYVRLALAGDEKIKVRKKDDGKVVLVSPETLKEKGGEYEEIKDEEGEAPPAEGKPKAETPAPAPAPGSSGPDPARVAEHTKAIQELAEQNPAFKSALDNWDKFDLPMFAQSTPKLPAKQFFPNVALPEGMTIGELDQARKAKPKDAPKKKTPKPKAEGGDSPASSESPDVKQLQDTIKGLVDAFKGITDELKTLKGEKPAPAPKSEDKPAPEPKSEDKPAPKEKPAPKDKPAPKGEDKPPAPPEPWPGRRKVSPREVAQAQTLISKALPAKMAAKFLDLHPDDAKQLVAHYDGLKQLGPMDDVEFESSMGRLKEGFTLDPKKVPPPKTWKRGKEEIAFEKLTPEEQEKATREHQMQVVAFNVAARQRAVETLRKRGMSSSVAAKVIDVQLSRTKIGATPEEHKKLADEREEAVRKVAQNTFVAGASSTEPVRSDAAREKALKALSDLPPEAQRVAVAEMQAEDYRAVAQKFLGKGNPKEMLSERDSPRAFKAKMSEALEEFERRAKGYPESATDGNPNPEKVFRQKVLSRLQAAGSPLYDEISKHFAKVDAERYDRDFRAYEKAKGKYEKDYVKYTKSFLAWEKRREKAESLAENPYRTTPKQAEEPPKPPREPREPVMPDGYYEATRQPAPKARQVKKQVEDMLRRVSDPEADRTITQRVKDRAKNLKDKFQEKLRGRKQKSDEKAWDKTFSRDKSASLYSSYGYRDLTMGTPLPTHFGTREAVYHGVEPAKTKAYPEWEQAHACEMGSSDTSAILASAREWLKSPVLSKSIEGMHPDARFRAALDLALRDLDGGKYSAAVNATAYNEMLSKLSGDRSEPLGTIRKEASLLAARVARFDPMLAYEILDYAAEKVQAKEAAVDETHAALRSSVIRTAYERPELREQLMPVLRLIKTIDEVRTLRAASRD